MVLSLNDHIKVKVECWSTTLLFSENPGVCRGCPLIEVLYDCNSLESAILSFVERSVFTSVSISLTPTHRLFLVLVVLTG